MFFLFSSSHGTQSYLQNSLKEHPKITYPEPLPNESGSSVLGKRKLNDSNSSRSSKKRRKSYAQVHPNPINVPLDGSETLTIRNNNSFDLLFKFRTNHPELVKISRRIGVIPKKMKLRIQLSGKGLGITLFFNLFQKVFFSSTLFFGKHFRWHFKLVLSSAFKYKSFVRFCSRWFMTSEWLQMLDLFVYHKMAF